MKYGRPYDLSTAHFDRLTGSEITCSKLHAFPHPAMCLTRARSTAWLGFAAPRPSCWPVWSVTSTWRSAYQAHPACWRFARPTVDFRINADRSGDDTTVSAVQHCPICLVAQAPASLSRLSHKATSSTRRYVACTLWTRHLSPAPYGVMPAVVLRPFFARSYDSFLSPTRTGARWSAWTCSLSKEFTMRTPYCRPPSWRLPVAAAFPLPSFRGDAPPK